MIDEEFLEESLRAYAPRLAWKEPSLERSFAELARDVSTLRARWRTAGLKAGDFIALYCQNQYQSWVCVLAAMGEGAVLALLPSRLTPTQLEPYLAQARFEFWVSEELRPSSRFRCLPLLWPLSPTETSHSLPLQPLRIEPESPCLLIYSSGSTGRPKAIQHSASSLLSSAAATLDFYRARVGDTWLLSLDLSHIGGLQIALRCLIGGLSCKAGFKPHELREGLHFHRPDFLSLVPTQLVRALKENRSELQVARAILLGGAACPSSLLEAAREATLPLSITYGSTETASQLAAFPPGVLPSDPREVGFLLSPWSAKILGESLAVRGSPLCQGWWQEGQFQPALQDFGAEEETWFLSSDKADLCGEILLIHGRDDGIFQVGGENLAPAEILEPLLALDAPGDFFVVPRADSQYGEVPILIYRGLEVPPHREAVLGALALRLPRIKWPRALYWHKSADVSKPSRLFYREMLDRQPCMELVWNL